MCINRRHQAIMQIWKIIQNKFNFKHKYSSLATKLKSTTHRCFQLSLSPCVNIPCVFFANRLILIWSRYGIVHHNTSEVDKKQLGDIRTTRLYLIHITDKLQIQNENTGILQAGIGKLYTQIPNKEKIVHCCVKWTNSFCFFHYYYILGVACLRFFFPLFFTCVVNPLNEVTIQKRPITCKIAQKAVLLYLSNYNV